MKAYTKQVEKWGALWWLQNGERLTNYTFPRVNGENDWLGFMISLFPSTRADSEFAFACFQLEAFDSEMGRTNRRSSWLLLPVSIWLIWISVGDVLIIRFSGDAVFGSCKMGSVDDALAAKIGCEVIWRFSRIIGSKVQSDIANES
jgi:hypothetical protein